MVRTNNEDAFLVRDGLFAVADGMGGLNAGEVASAIAVETLERWNRSGAPPGSISEPLTEANRLILARAQGASGSMGTTCTAASVDGERLLIAHVGDSRAYLLRDGKLTRVTRDHSRVARMVAEGVITEEQAAAHPERNVITRALGIEGSVSVDEVGVEPRSGDRLLLCSDGVHGMIGDEAIAGILGAGSDPEETARLLVRAANEAGGADNCTAVVVFVDEAGAGRERSHRALWVAGGAAVAVVTAIAVFLAFRIQPASERSTGGTPAPAASGAATGSPAPPGALADPVDVEALGAALRSGLPAGWTPERPLPVPKGGFSSLGPGELAGAARDLAKAANRTDDLVGSVPLSGGLGATQERFRESFASYLLASRLLQQAAAPELGRSERRALVRDADEKVKEAEAVFVQAYEQLSAFARSAGVGLPGS
jgi:serine/threonine protein phosphatase PrpC